MLRTGTNIQEGDYPNPSSAVNSTTTLDFRASGLAGSGLVLTCCKEGCENNLEKLENAGFPHMQTQGCTCLPSGTFPRGCGIFPGVQDGEEWDS
ncbi:MAG: hypothetical protein CL923_09710 [Deltaproteobacteria bacterium]|nr:hypothetical protein [Deltaproteobacteria bacterium]